MVILPNLISLFVFYLSHLPCYFLGFQHLCMAFHKKEFCNKSAAYKKRKIHSFIASVRDFQSEHPISNLPANISKVSNKIFIPNGKWGKYMRCWLLRLCLILYFFSLIRKLISRKFSRDLSPPHSCILWVSTRILATFV